jgi:serine protease Do
LIDHSWDLPTVISQLPPGTQARLGVWHDRKATEVSVKTILLEESPTQVAKVSSDEGGGKLGLRLRPLEPREQQELHTKGHLVVEDVSGPALAAGLEAGRRGAGRQRRGSRHPGGSEARGCARRS